MQPANLFLIAAATLFVASFVQPQLGPPSSMQLPTRRPKPLDTIWIMAIASDETVQPCRALVDCPQAVRRADSMFDEYALYGKVALLSAKEHAPSLLPVLLYPGSRNAFVQWFEQQGGLAFHHRSSLLPRWQAAVAAGNLSDTMYMAESLYLRFDIPAIAPAIIEALEANGSDVSTINTTHVLFTDTDVVWVKDFDSSIIPTTDVVAVGAEEAKGGVANAGILYINVEGAREPFADMYDWAEAKWRWHNVLTQAMLLEFVKTTGNYSRLPDAYNYKPYWGDADGEARCVHYHGPKPDRCLPCYLGVALLEPKRIGECNCSHYDAYWHFGVGADNARFFARMQHEFQLYRRMALTGLVCAAAQPDTYSGVTALPRPPTIGAQPRGQDADGARSGANAEAISALNKRTPSVKQGLESHSSIDINIDT